VPTDPLDSRRRTSTVPQRDVHSAG